MDLISIFWETYQVIDVSLIKLLVLFYCICDLRELFIKFIKIIFSSSMCDYNFYSFNLELVLNVIFCENE